MREITQIFISRAELLSAGETMEDHKKWQQEEADIVEKDKKDNGHGGGLFAGRFRHSRHHNASAIRDVEDGVDRCPMCAWELTDEGYCTSCAFEFDNGYPLSGSASLSVSDFTEDDDGAFFMGDDVGLFDTLDPDNMSPLEESAHRSIIHLGNLNHRVSPRMSAEVETRPRTLRPHLMHTLDQHVRRPRFTTATDDEFEDTDDYTSEEDDAGSLRSFIDEGEIEHGHLMQLSPRSSHYDSDEASGIFEALGSYSSDEQSDDRGDNDVSRENTTHESKPGSSANSPNIISVEDDDSDEGPVLRSRARAHRRPLASSESNRTERNLPPLTWRRRSTREPHRQASGDSAMQLHQRNSQTTESSSTVLRAISIETESDSGSSPLARRLRTRLGRSAPSRIISDDEDDAATVSSGNTSASSRQSSSGTMTIGRQSPARLDPSNQEDLATVEPPIVLSSSPGRLNAPAYQRVYPQLNVSAEHARRPHPPNLEPTHEFPQRSAGSPGSRRIHRNSWSPRRHVQSSSHTHHAVRNTTSALHSHTIQRIQQIARERVVRRAGRMLTKERTQRRAREHASEDFGPPLATAEPGGVRVGSWFPSEEWN